MFLTCGHTAEPFTVTDGVWRADIQGFVEAPEGLWRPVNTTTEDSIGGEVTDIARYGHTATVLDTGESDPTEVWLTYIALILTMVEATDVTADIVLLL